MTAAERWPFDPDAVTKGSVVMSAEQIDRYVQAPRESKKRRLAVLHLSKMLKRCLAQRGIVGWTICEREEALVVLSDQEASPYNHRRLQESVRAIFESHLRQTHVDTTQLPDAERAEHDRRLMRSSYLIAGVSAAQKKTERRRLGDGNSDGQTPTN